MTYRYDLQVHTDASPCSRSTPGDVVDAAIAAGLDGIVVTDHDTMTNVRAVQKAAPPELTVVPGVEVSTIEGHVLAIDVSDAPPRSDAASVVDEIHDQGGFAIPSHPFDSFRENFGGRLQEVVDAIDAVEAVNSRCIRSRFNDRAAEFAARHDLPTTGGSDAHFPFEVGRSYTVAERPLLEALRRGETSGAGRGRYLSGHFLTKLNDWFPRVIE